MRISLLSLLLVLVVAGDAAAAADPLRPRQWNLDLVGSDAAHARSTGLGAVVAVVDSGAAASHPGLMGRLVPGRDFVQDDATPQDGNGHGTHVAGIVGAAKGNGVGVSSVAPRAGIMPVRVLADDGSGTTEDVVAGIDWARTHGADVINLSLGSDIPIVGAVGGDELDAAIRRALSAGIVVVAAAGNNGVPVCEQPASGDGLLCVGAVDRRSQRSFFSSFGQGLGVVAPGGSALLGSGEDVLSTVPPAGYEEFAGTSQAAPHAAGVAALLVSLGVRGRSAVDRILSTATDLGPPGTDAQYGHGLVNARAAVGGVTPRPGSPAALAAKRPFVKVRRRQRAGRAVRLRVRSSVSGRVHVRVRARGRTVARAVRRVRAGRARTIRARARLTRSSRAAAPFRSRVRVRLPGESRVRVRRVRIVR